jgi:hypothetical protein
VADDDSSPSPTTSPEATQQEQRGFWMFVLAYMRMVKEANPGATNMQRIEVICRINDLSTASDDC